MCGSLRVHRVQRNGDPAATGRVLELSMGTPLDNDHPSPVGRELALPVDRSHVGGVASRGWYAAGVTILPTPVLVHAPETPETHKPTATKGNSSGRLIHAASGSCGALGGFLKRPGWAR